MRPQPLYLRRAVKTCRETIALLPRQPSSEGPHSHGSRGNMSPSWKQFADATIGGRGKPLRRPTSRPRSEVRLIITRPIAETRSGHACLARQTGPPAENAQASCISRDRGQPIPVTISDVQSAKFASVMRCGDDVSGPCAEDRDGHRRDDRQASRTPTKAPARRSPVASSHGSRNWMAALVAVDPRHCEHG